MRIGYDFNQFDLKRSSVNFIQVFGIGYITMMILLFSWSATSEYGLQKTADDFSLDLALSPMFWFFPLMVAVVVGFIKGLNYAPIDVSNPEELDQHFKRQEFSNQPKWFKLSVAVFATLFIVSLIRPDSKISSSEHKRIINILLELDSKELTEFYRVINMDKKIYSSEHHDFMLLSLKLRGIKNP